jgi:hypothetical protein
MTTKYAQYTQDLILFLFGAAVVLILTGCATTDGTRQGPTLQEVRDTACPIVIGVVMGLQVEPSIDQVTRDRLGNALPGIEQACSYSGDFEDLKALSQVAFTPLMAYIGESNMTAEQKQAAIIALTTAKLVILSYHPPKAVE